MNKTFKRTAKQKEQTALLSGPHKHAMSYGGSRSGKTFGICRALVIRAMKCKSRHLAVRLRFNHAKTSLWYETFPKVFDLCFPSLKVHQNRSDWFYGLENGSEIWIGGLDEKDRVEKILGKEYSTIYFNECSQIPWGSVSVALTRLAEKNELKKRAWYDENPPSKRHWSYPLFVKGQDPETWEPKPNAHQYGTNLMNPDDNLENIDSDYVADVLDMLPDEQRKRFRHGEFGDDPSGKIYHAFSRERHVKPCPRMLGVPLTLGMDFNVNPFTYTVGQLYVDEATARNKLRIIAEGFLHNSHTKAAAEDINRRFPGHWTIIPDSTGNARKTSASGKVDHQILRDHGFQIPFVRNPFRMDRYNEVNEVFASDDIEIDPQCKNLIADLEQVSYLEGSNQPDETDPMRVHISDALGYKIHWAFPLAKIETSVSMVGR